MHSASLPQKPVLFDRQFCSTLSGAALTSAKSMGEFRIGITLQRKPSKLNTEPLCPTRRESLSFSFPLEGILSVPSLGPTLQLQAVGGCWVVPGGDAACPKASSNSWDWEFPLGAQSLSRLETARH